MISSKLVNHRWTFSKNILKDYDQYINNRWWTFLKNILNNYDQCSNKTSFKFWFKKKKETKLKIEGEG